MHNQHVTLNGIDKCIVTIISILTLIKNYQLKSNIDIYATILTPITFLPYYPTKRLYPSLVQVVKFLKKKGQNKTLILTPSLLGKMFTFENVHVFSISMHIGRHYSYCEQ